MEVGSKMDKGAILLNDMVGEKAESTFGGFVRRVVGGKLSTMNVLKGELLEQIPGDAIVPRSEGQNFQKPYNYRLVKDPAVALYCSETDIAPLSDKEFLLLEAIQSQLTRYEVFILGNKLEWGCHLKPGDPVYVSIPGLTVIPHHRAAAVIRYVGGLPPDPGLMFGIEIRDEQCRGYGTTDGTFRNERYFHCEDKCGLFVALDKLSMDSEGNTLEKPPRGGQSYAKVASHGTAASSRSYPQESGGPADNTRARSQAINKRPIVHDDPHSRFKKGDRVVAFDKKGHRIHGKVGWVGKNETIRKCNFIVGIETDVAVSTVDFEGALPGMTYTFSAPKNRRLMMPDTAILSEEEAAGTSVDHQNKPHHTENIDIENTSILAKNMGMSKKQLMASQTAVLKEAEKSKKEKAAQELKLLEQALPDQSVNLDRQRAALQAFEKENNEAKVAKRSSLPPRSETYTGEDPTHLQPHKPQRQHSYEPVLNGSPSSRYKLLGSHAKSASVTQGEQIYDRLDHGYQQRPPHEFSGQPQPPQRDLCSQQLQKQQPPQQVYQPLQQPPQWSQQSLQEQSQWPQQPSHHTQQPFQQPQPPPYQQYPDAGMPLSSGETVAIVASSTDNQLQVHRSLSEGSTVQLVTFGGAGSQQPRYGVIRWVGEITGVMGTIAGIELEEPMEGCTDGTSQMTGQKFFDCPDGRGLYFPLAHLRPDERFTDPGTTPGAAVVANPLSHVPLEEPSDQHVHSQQIFKYLGDERGIQGHQNSCYLDATVFGLFGLSDGFDSMFLEQPTNSTQQEVSSILWKRIVNPLRKNGVVRYESVMQLRNKLEELGKMKGIAQDEKDPEEFLNMLFKHTLQVEPFIHIRRPFGTEQEYFVQLFLEYDDSMKLPTVGGLLTKMFKEQKISFTELPPKLLIQVPRFGKQFKTYQKIIPDLSLDVSDLTDSTTICRICGSSSAWWKCKYCIGEFTNTSQDSIPFCRDCVKKVHEHPDRSSHKYEMSVDADGKLDLLSVICIETSHYVCFTRVEDQWILFDSMANRVYDMYNIPKVVECTRQLKEWVYSGDHQRLLDTPPRDLPEFVRRFTQDIYMCVYINPDAGMYG